MTKASGARPRRTGPGKPSRQDKASIALLKDRPAGTLDSKQQSQPRMESPRLRLLVVEDDEVSKEVLTRLLRRRGLEVLTAGSVQVAIVLASKHPFDLVISDLGLPDGNGIDLMQQLARECGLHGIAVSGYGMPGDCVGTQAAGFLAHLAKPIKFSQLQCVLEAIAPTAGEFASPARLGRV